MATKKNAGPKAPSSKAVAPSVRDGIESQLDDLRAPALDRAVRVQAVLATLKHLELQLGGVATDSPNKQLSNVIKIVDAIARQKKSFDSFGTALVDLDIFVALLPAATADVLRPVLEAIATQIKTLLKNPRPDVQAVLEDLEALKHLRGGPADATAIHELHILQIAFKSVWKHAFDKNVQALVEQVYLEHMKLYDDAGLTMPPFGAISDVNDLTNFLGVSLKSIDPPPNLMVKDPSYEANVAALGAFAFLAANTVPEFIPSVSLQEVLTMFQASTWYQLSPEQQYCVWQEAAIAKTSSDPNEVARARKVAQAILDSPAGPAGRIATLLYRLGRALNEPYAFDVFAPNSYNFGIMLTYRQKWQPIAYQAGELVKTLPLAPGESRKYSARRVVRNTRAVKELEKSLSSSAYQTSETSRAEADIMRRTTMATNFKMNADGSFNIGIGSIHSGTEFSTNQSTDSAAVKKDFHEATVKAAQEYRLERSMEVDTTATLEDDQTTSGEISNPNNEITVTYLFYELQRRYTVTEFLYGVRPVIMVALDVPAPHEIDEAWLTQQQWIIARALLDDSFRPALAYLSSGFAGDEVSTEVQRRHWETQQKLVDTLEESARIQMAARDELRMRLVDTQQQKDSLPEMPGALKFFTMGMDPTQQGKDLFEANIKALQTRLGYTEGALADTQEKLKAAASAFDAATKAYTAALQNKFTRRVAIDQLRVHVKQNILYYMQAIWSHRVSDQTFFELYKLPIACPEPTAATFTPPSSITTKATRWGANLWQGNLPQPSATWHEHELVEVADIDNPLGFKGNFIIFPMKDYCYLTWFMLQDFIDGYTKGLRDPDKIAYFLENFDRHWLEAQAKGNIEIDGETFTPQQLKDRLKEYVSTTNRSVEDIIVPTGQLFIEALPGSHPVLEDFKLLHRVEDVRKVKAEVRHAELENLRLAARVLGGQLRDPDIDRNILVEGGANVTVNDA